MKERRKQKVRKPFPAAAIPALLAILLYLNTLPGQYCLDDYCVVYENSYVKSGISAIPQILTTNFFNGLKQFNDGLYRPLPILTYAIEYEFAGLEPWIRHLVNVLFYAMIGWVMFVLLKRLLRSTSDLVPGLISLLYIAHPVHTEAVANIKGRDEVMAFLFSLLALHLLIRYVDEGRPAHLVMGLFSFILGLLSKESSVMFLFVIPLTILMFRKAGIRKLLIVVVPMVVITAGWLLWRDHVIRSMSQPVDPGIFSALNNSVLSTDNLSMRLATGLYLQVLYILKMIIPYPLSHDYSFNQIPVISFTDLKGIIALVVLAAAGTAILILFRKQKLIAYGILFYFLTIVTVANIFLYIGATFAERFLFTPSFGFAIISGVLLLKLIKKDLQNRKITAVLSRNRLFAILTVFVLVLYSGLTVARNSDWKNNLVLYSSDVHHSPNSARVHYNYGTELYNNSGNVTDNERKYSDLSLAAQELKTAIGIYPNYQDAWNNLGNVYSLLKMNDSAIYCYQQTIRLDSSYRKGYLNTGIVYYNMGDYRNAVDLFKQYTKGGTEDPYILYLTGNAFGYLGNFDSALVYLERCIALQPENKDALILAGKAYGIKGLPDRSRSFFEKVLSLDPNNEEARRNLELTDRLIEQEAKKQ